MKYIDYILGIPKSLIVNLKYLPINQAIKLPILVSHKTKIYGNGKIRIVGNVQTGMIKIGLTGSGTAKYNSTVIENNGTLILDGRIYFGGGCQICTVNSDSRIEIGDGTRFMGECHLIAARKVKIGSDCAISWNTQIMDTDYHKIYDCDAIVNPDCEIEVGNHVWIASLVTIMKGSKIPDGTVIAARSMINSRCKIDSNNCVVTGLPFKILKKSVDWCK